MIKTEKFLDKYRQLEDVVRHVYHLQESESISYFLTKQGKYKKYADKIRYCQEVRNFLAHKKTIDGNFAIEASDAMIMFIEDLINIINNRPKCSDIHISFKNIYWRDLNDPVKETISVMRQHLYTHVPILNSDGVVVGVFDENSIFAYIADEEIVSIDGNLNFRDIQKYLQISEREMESFIYIQPNMYVEELETLIDEAFHKGKRIGLVFVTASGKSCDKLQGIITPWDIISSKPNDSLSI